MVTTVTLDGVYVFVGADGLGKTTATKNVAKVLEGAYFKYPYGSSNETPEPVFSGIKIREFLNNTENPIDPMAFQCVNFVNKLEGIPEIEVLQAKYGWVFVDRWWLCMRVYGEADGVPDDLNRFMCSYLDDIMLPDMTFLFVGKPFRKEENDIYGKKQDKISALYEKYYEEYKDLYNIVKIDVTDKSEWEIVYEILNHIGNRAILA
jgi:thymidylate kinase